ncbi:MAG TPA: phage tail protein [Scandinavium sp.]
MAQVTGLTAEKMQEIADASVVTGAVDGSGHLQLTTSGGSTVDAGDVKGPQGIQGIQGPAGSTGNAPPGAITMFGALIPPTGWLVCDGSAVSRTTYAALFAVLAASFGPGDGATTFNLPNFAARMPRQDNANFAVAGGVAPTTHHHQIDGGTPAAVAHIAFYSVGSPSLFMDRQDTAAWTADFEGSVTAPAFSTASKTTGAVVSGNTNDTADNLPPFLNVCFIIKF